MTMGSIKRLSDCRVGESATIRSVELEPGARQRLLEMGLLMNSRIEVVRFAPLGDPMEIKVRGYFLSLRKSEASKIQVSVP